MFIVADLVFLRYNDFIFSRVADEIEFLIFLAILFFHLSHGVASGSDITQCMKLVKPLFSAQSFLKPLLNERKSMLKS